MSGRIIETFDGDDSGNTERLLIEYWGTTIVRKKETFFNPQFTLLKAIEYYSSGNQQKETLANASAIERLDENIGSVNIELTSSDLSDIEQAFSQITVQGNRYTEEQERMTGL